MSGRIEWAQQEGAPVAMAGAAERHDPAVVNLIATIRPQLRGSGCRAFFADYAVKIPAGNVRRPNAGINCAPVNERALAAPAPRAAIEVLSPRTLALDRLRNLEEYKTVTEIRHIVLIDPDLPQVFHWQRDDAGAWNSKVLEGLDAMLTFADVQVRLALSLIYEDLEFRPRLVE